MKNYTVDDVEKLVREFLEEYNYNYLPSNLVLKKFDKGDLIYYMRKFGDKAFWVDRLKLAPTKRAKPVHIKERKKRKNTITEELVIKEVSDFIKENKITEFPSNIEMKNTGHRQLLYHMQLFGGKEYFSKKFGIKIKKGKPTNSKKSTTEDLVTVNNKARENGMSYGQYRAMEYIKGVQYGENI